MYIGAMSDATTTPLTDVIETRLRAALSPLKLLVENDSRHHAGHAGHDGSGESHFTVRIESEAFAGLSRVARQRLVNTALADLLIERIHALAIKATAPGDTASEGNANGL